MLCLLFMLDQSLEMPLRLAEKIHFFWGQLRWVLLWCEYGAVFCAGGRKHKNPACCIDSHLHWVSCSG